MGDTDEKLLIERARQDPSAFGPIYDRYVERIYAFLYRRTGNNETAEDLTAATFEAALRNVKRFRWKGAGITAWLYRIARNKLIGHYRRQQITDSLNALLARRTQMPGRAEFAEQFETNDWLITAYRKLTARDREVIALRFFEGLSSDEAAAVLDCSKSNLYVRLHRALRRLARELEPPENADE